MKIVVLFIVAGSILGGALVRDQINNSRDKEMGISTTGEVNLGGPENLEHPLSVEYMRKQEYPGSQLVIEQTLSPGSNYQRYIASYLSEGLKQFALLTVPNGERPETGWPAVVFNHGYIPPADYRTTERYIAYTDAFSRNGYVLLRPDYRGHGNSEGRAGGAYGSPAYTIDVLNALASLKQYDEVDLERIGMWGHSMGGSITLRAMVIDPSIRAGVIWAGVVGSYPDLMTIWPAHRQHNSYRVGAPTNPNRRSWRNDFTNQYGDYQSNPNFWDSISPTSFLSDVSGPIQLHHGTADTSVPLEFSELLDQRMKQAGQLSEIFVYQGDDHNISTNFSTAMNRSVQFFDKHVKGEL